MPRPHLGRASLAGVAVVVAACGGAGGHAGADGAPVDAALADAAPPPPPGHCPLPPAPTPVTPTPCGPDDGTAITSLPYTIAAGGAYCLAVDGNAGQPDGITIAADGVTLAGHEHHLFGPVSIVDRHDVTVTGIISDGGLGVSASDEAAAGNISISDSRFAATGAGGAFTVDGPVKGVTVQRSRFTCACDQGELASMCVHLISETAGAELEPFTFQDNVVVSDCVKTMKVTAGGAAGGAVPVRHVLRDNYFLSTHDGDGDEVFTFSWRNAPGGTAEAERNVFAGNSVVAQGNANGIYLRDDLDNADFVDDCVEVQNPSNRSVFYAAIMTSSGNNAPFTDPSGLRFVDDRVYATTVPALLFQGYQENPPGDGNRTILRGSVFASRDAAAVVWGAEPGALATHDTFYSEAADAAAVTFDGGAAAVAPEFDDDIFACANQRDGFRHDCLVIPGDASNYGGTHNLLYDYAAPGAVEVYAGGQVTLAAWQALGEDVGSIEGDPQFVDRAGLDFSLGAGSPALGAASDGTGIGAIQP